MKIGKRNLQELLYHILFSIQNILRTWLVSATASGVFENPYQKDYFVPFQGYMLLIGKRSRLAIRFLGLFQRSSIRVCWMRFNPEESNSFIHINPNPFKPSYPVKMPLWSRRLHPAKPFATIYLCWIPFSKIRKTELYTFFQPKH